MPKTLIQLFIWKRGIIWKKELLSLFQTDSRIFSFIQDLSLDGMWYWDLENPQHEWLSSSFWKTLGYDPAKKTHQSEAWKNIIFAQDLELSKKNLRRHLDDPSFPYDQVVRYRHQNGSTVWIRCRGVAIRDARGKPIRMLGAHIDITAVKQREEELQSFLDDANDLIQSVDEQGRYVYVNRAWCQTLGYTVQEAEHLTVYDVADPEFHDVCRERTAQLHVDRKSISVSAIFRSKAGEAVFVDGNVSVSVQSNGTILIRGIFRDVSTRHHAEKELRRTQEMLAQTNQVARVGGWEVDLLHDTIFWTQMTKEIHEVEPDFVPDLQAGIGFYKEGYSRDRVLKIVDQAIETGEPFEEDLQIVTARGRERWVRSIGRAERKNGQTIRLYGTFQDIEQQKHNEQALLGAMEEARAASVAKSEFLANMSHEIRTPLNGVVGFTDLLLKTRMDQNQQQYLQSVHHSANALLDLINDILDFSKIEAGKLELSQVKTPLWEMLEQVCDIVKHNVEEKKLEFLLHIAPDVPQYIWVDAIRLRQIIINLVSNAIKFTETGEIELSVAVVNQNSSHDTSEPVCLEFAVRDTGIGIEEKRQQSIFQAFSQQDASTTRKYGGTGLGLTISSQLLEMMGSGMKLDSQPGKGSRFSFQLMVKALAQPQDPIVMLKPIYRALVVDDHLKNCKIIQDMLSLHNITSQVASDGPQALAMLEKENYDVAFIDYCMPQMDGLQLIREIRETRSIGSESLAIVLLHSSANDQAVNEARNWWIIQKVMSKPITYRQLTLVLASLDSFNPESVQERDASGALSEQSVHVLLVDDNAMNRKLVQTMLPLILPKAVVEEAEDGRQAIEKFSQNGADIIFMDVQMPQISGYQASQQIRTLEGGKDVIIIALTAGTVKGERKRCLEAGMDDYLSKPFVLETLRETLIPWIPKLRQISSNSAVEFRAESKEHFNLERCKSMLHISDDESIRELVNELISPLQTDIALLHQAWLEEDIVRLRAIGHKHQSSARMMTMDALADLLNCLEECTSFDSAEVEQTILQLEEELQQVRVQINQHWPENSARQTD